MEQIYSRKSCDLKFKDVDTTKGIVSGYFASFDTLDSDGDIFVKGAFQKTIQERGPLSKKPRIKHFLNHSTSSVPAVITELSEDNTGLSYVSKAGSHTLGRDFVLMVQDGIITEHSVGFQTIREEKGENEKVNYIKEVLLWEGSSLTAWGANENTPITGLKSLSKEAIQERFDRLQKLIKAFRNGNYSDETFELIEIEIKQREQDFLDLISPVDTGAPEQSTQQQDTPEEEKKELDYDVKSICKRFKDTILN